MRTKRKFFTLKKVNRGQFTKPCQYCGGDMILNKGARVYYYNIQTKQVQSYDNPDQVSYWHGKCRREGRKEQYKLNKGNHV